ncbi:hypothetical protein [Burkholderia metallica]|uniref:Uncharacterized protein n=1 Tax=Burkholderia metallica TaxID=488729 RepID=A0ABT8PBA6_9BURK|nr:hypothetical protein [Burkholderia metallica]MCA8021134.1 hypothetical protein [Burkholderia metallica]MDN7932398.1 hypothetical protein [Burkholderia metallica]
MSVGAQPPASASTGFPAGRPGSPRRSMHTRCIRDRPFRTACHAHARFLDWMAINARCAQRDTRRNRQIER